MYIIKVQEGEGGGGVEGMLLTRIKGECVWVLFYITLVIIISFFGGFLYGS